jgi:hypothetical protein
MTSTCIFDDELGMNTAMRKASWVEWKGKTMRFMVD